MPPVPTSTVRDSHCTCVGLKILGICLKICLKPFATGETPVLFVLYEESPYDLIKYSRFLFNHFATKKVCKVKFNYVSSARKMSRKSQTTFISWLSLECESFNP